MLGLSYGHLKTLLSGECRSIRILQGNFHSSLSYFKMLNTKYISYLLINRSLLFPNLPRPISLTECACIQIINTAQFGLQCSIPFVERKNVYRIEIHVINYINQVKSNNIKLFELKLDMQITDPLHSRSIQACSV